jgi:hypothetical protein
MKARVDPVAAITEERRDIQQRVRTRLGELQSGQSLASPTTEGFDEMVGALTAVLAHSSLEGLRQVAARMKV